MSPDDSRPSHRVLVIEDYAELAEVVADLIQSQGLDVRVALTGREALELAAAFHPEIVLCDVRLPDMSGVALARQLRAMAFSERLIIAIHSAMTEHEFRSLDGSDDPAVSLFLPKPFSVEKLNSLVSKLESQAVPKP